jgi:hypothetical protein
MQRIMRLFLVTSVVLALATPATADRLLARLSGTWADGIVFRAELRAGKESTRLKVWEGKPGQTSARTLVVDVPDFLPLPDFKAARDVPESHRVTLALEPEGEDPALVATLINDYSIYGGIISIRMRPVDDQLTVTSYVENFSTEASASSCAVQLLTDKVKVNGKNRRAPVHALEEKAAVLWHVGRAQALGYCP